MLGRPWELVLFRYFFINSIIGKFGNIPTKIIFRDGRSHPCNSSSCIFKVFLVWPIWHVRFSVASNFCFSTWLPIEHYDINLFRLSNPATYVPTHSPWGWSCHPLALYSHLHSNFITHDDPWKVSPIHFLKWAQIHNQIIVSKQCFETREGDAMNDLNRGNRVPTHHQGL